ncbi:MAG: rhodanese-like domain-containing protein, partial [Candidatus Thiodiazotropha endolucinida]
MKNFLNLISDSLTDVKEIMPWDLEERMQDNPGLLIVDVREPYEYDAMHIEGSLAVPRGILESACEWDYEETVPELVNARQREIV